MKFAPLAAALLLATATTPAFADAEATVAEAAATPTIDMSIEQLIADERSKAVLEKHLPGISEHPAYGQFKGMTLVELQPWSGGMITDEGITKITTDLAAIDQAGDASTAAEGEAKAG